MPRSPLSCDTMAVLVWKARGSHVMNEVICDSQIVCSKRACIQKGVDAVAGKSQFGFTTVQWSLPGVGAISELYLILQPLNVIYVDRGIAVCVSEFGLRWAVSQAGALL